MAAPFQNFHVTAEQVGQTLAAMLRKAVEGKSWNQLRRMIHKRHVQINGNLCVDEGRRLKSGDVVKVWAEPIAGPVEATDVAIVYSDRHVVVVEKPAGITSTRHHEEKHWSPRRKQFQLTLDELLPKALALKEKGRKAQPKIGRQRSPYGSREEHPAGRLPPVRPVHRLDRETSGLMVFARSEDAEQGLIQQFRQHENERVYLAIVVGHIEAQKIESNLVVDRGDGRRGSTTLPKVGKQAVTHIRPLETAPGYTLVECQLETGRTHQIRIHLSESGHPICGDKIYNHPLGGKMIADRSGARRQALHAAELVFTHPIKMEEMRFRKNLPDDLVELWERLKGEE